MEPLRVDEWLAELQKLEAEHAEGFARVDLETALGIGEGAASERIRRWFKAGRIEHSGWRQGRGSDGRMTRVPVYRLKQ